MKNVLKTTMTWSCGQLELDMNERIKELAEQAGAGRRAGISGLVFRNNELEKFAELIVRECLSIVEPTEDSGDEWCVTLKGTAQEIKEHFGVEE